MPVTGTNLDIQFILCLILTDFIVINYIIFKVQNAHIL